MLGYLTFENYVFRRKELELLATYAISLRWIFVNVCCGDSEAFLGLNKLIGVNTRLTYVKVGIKDLIDENRVKRRTLLEDKPYDD